MAVSRPRVMAVCRPKDFGSAPSYWRERSLKGYGSEPPKGYGSAPPKDFGSEPSKGLWQCATQRTLAVRRPMGESVLSGVMAVRRPRTMAVSRPERECSLKGVKWPGFTGMSSGRAMTFQESHFMKKRVSFFEGCRGFPSSVFRSVLISKRGCYGSPLLQ